MWERWTLPAADHTIPLALRPFLARRDDAVVVIEPGIGGRWDEKWRAIYAIERAVTLESSLAACGVAAEQVTHVIATHCHFDHCGGWVVERDGALAPLFPNARHFAPAIEVAAAKDPDPVRRASYRAEDVLPIEAAGLLETFDARDVAAGVELLPGLRAHDASGHSDGVCVLTLDERGAAPARLHHGLRPRRRALLRQPLALARARRQAPLARPLLPRPRARLRPRAPRGQALRVRAGRRVTGACGLLRVR
jgi:glyoxylase-like metal-dependent hydrolase (beta-lactamase superfamily II)